MATSFVQVIAPENILRPEYPDLGSIYVHGAARVLPNIEVDGLIWWRAMVEATNTELKAWRNAGAKNIGWLSGSLPDATDVTRLWNGLWGALQTLKPVGSDFWAVAPDQSVDPDDLLGPDLNSTLNPLTTAHKIMIDYSNFKDKFILWAFDSTASNAQLNAWVTDNPGLGWKTGNPPSDASLFINKIAVAADNTQRFSGAEVAP